MRSVCYIHILWSTSTCLGKQVARGRSEGEYEAWQPSKRPLSGLRRSFLGLGAEVRCRADAGIELPLVLLLLLHAVKGWASSLGLCDRYRLPDRDLHWRSAVPPALLSRELKDVKFRALGAMKPLPNTLRKND